MELLRAVDSLAVQRAVAGALAARGLRPGDRIVLQVRASAALLSTVLAVLRRGIVPVVLDPELTAEDVREWARERLAPYKRPKEYHLLDELPRTSTGKVRRLGLAGLVNR